MHSPPENIKFYFDIVCPYAFLASLRIDALAAQYGATVTWVPILLGGVLKALGGPTTPTDGMNPPKARHQLHDITRQGRQAGLDLRLPPDHPRRTVSAMRLILAAPPEVQKAVAQDLYAAYWVRGEDVRDPALLAAVATRHGFDAKRIEDQDVKDALHATTAEAQAAGVFGVPTMVVGERMFWGQDRLHLVEAALGGPTRAPAPVAGEKSDATIRVFHDFSSPFSYLGHTQLERLAVETGATVVPTPILLGGLFREVGTADVPMFKLSVPKRAWVARDLADWAAWWGVPFRFPDHFPLRSVLPLRITLVEPAAAACLYRAYWAENTPIETPEQCKKVLDSAGFDGAALIAATESPAVKEALKANTAAAVAAGAFGVPTYIIERPGHAPQLIWGQDRLALVRAAVRGEI